MNDTVLIENGWIKNLDGTYSNTKQFAFNDAGRYTVVPGSIIVSDKESPGVTRKLQEALEIEKHRPV
jgi:hypothetical protein